MEHEERLAVPVTWKDGDRVLVNERWEGSDSLVSAKRGIVRYIYAKRIGVRKG